MAPIPIARRRDPDGDGPPSAEGKILLLPVPAGALTSRDASCDPRPRRGESVERPGAVAAEQLYREHRSLMLAYARRCLRDEDAAKDAVSDAFERFMKAEPTLRSKAPEVARAYLFTILRNRLATPPRATVPFEEEMGGVQAEVEAEVASPSSAATPEELRQAITLLPESLRTPLLLFHFERMSHRQISEAMKISTLAVAMRLFKARRKLRVVLLQVLAQRGLDFDPQRDPGPRSGRGRR